MLQTTTITWVGFCKRVTHEKLPGSERKVLEIPFKLNGTPAKFLLRITKHTAERQQDFYYDVREITHEQAGIYETLLLNSYTNRTSALIDAVLADKKAKRAYRWMKGWFG